MARPNNSGGEKAAPATDAAPATEKPKRVHVIGGIPHPVVDTYFDPAQNAVIDVIEKTKIVQNRRGDDVEVTIYRHTYCNDKDLQAKFKRDGSARVRVEE